MGMFSTVKTGHFWSPLQLSRLQQLFTVKVEDFIATCQTTRLFDI